MLILWGVASTKRLGVLSVRRGRRQFLFASSMVGWFGVLVVFPVIIGLRRLHYIVQSIKHYASIIG